MNNADKKSTELETRDGKQNGKSTGSGELENKIKSVTLIQTYLNIAFGVVSLRLFATFVLYVWLGEYFIVMPFMLELFLDYLFLGIGFVFSRKRHAGLEIAYIVWLGIDIICNLIVLAIVLPILKNFLFEPTGVINEDWTWLWSALVFYFIFCAFAMAIQLALIVVTILKLKWIKKTKFKYAIKPKSKAQRKALFTAKYVAYTAVMIVIVILVILSIISAVQVGSNTGFCAPGDLTCYSNCNPVDPSACILPYPSSYYLVTDASTVTGYRVNFGANTLPKIKVGDRINPKYWNELDGFSTTAPLLFNLPDVVNASMIPFWNMGLYTLANATSILINTKTGQRIPHWLEIDQVDSNWPVVVMQPGVSLDFNTRYVAGIRGLTNSNGQVIAAPEGMKAMIDKTNSDDQISNTYNSIIFPALATEGFLRSELQMAWDFVTNSMNSSLGRAQHMRDDAVRLYEAGGYTFAIDRVDEFDCKTDDTMARNVWGHFTAPFYLNGTERGSMLPRENGRRVMTPTASGTKNNNFLLRIPCSLVKKAAPAKMLVEYGHGLFGNRNELLDKQFDIMANNYDWIFYATDWYGMATFDVLAVLKVLINDLTDFPILPESVNQGWSARAVGLRMLLNEISDNDALKVNGVRLLTPDTPRQFYGNSQGAVVGGGFATYSRDFTRVALMVPGSPFALLLGRSSAFTFYSQFMNLQFYTWFDIRIGLSLIQSFWDPAESAGWLNLLNRDVQPGFEPKQALLQAAHGDSLVTPLGAMIMARSYGASAIAPSYEPLFGLPDRTAPFSNSSAMMIWKYRSVPDGPYNNLPANTDFNTHGCPRQERNSQDQMRDFLETGVINQYCGAEGCVKDKCG